MSFVVEMFNGVPHFTEIMDLNADGEWFVAEVIKYETIDPEYRTFSCCVSNWEKALKLGEEMGWKPIGTILKKTLNTEKPVISDYEPSTWDYVKIFREEDALSFASALEKSLNKKAKKNKKHDTDENKPLSRGFLKEFISFLKKGKFGFAYDD